MFMKLIKDERATLENKRQVYRFIDGMESYESKAELLGILDDKRNLGSKRIRQALSMMDKGDDVDTILRPILLNVNNEETGRPLYKPLRNRILNTIYTVPGLLSYLVQFATCPSSSTDTLRVICSFLEIMAMVLVEARSSEDMKAIAKALRYRDGVNGVQLCSLLLIDEEEDKTRISRSSRASNQNIVTKAACWITDEVPPGGRHDNDHRNFRDIQLVPTGEELSSEFRPWLPLSSCENAIIGDKVMRMLDSNFRLLREDAVSTMRADIAECKGIWYNAHIVGVSGTTESKF